jgi:predicted CxxxxCH...CXXCH cytochrome family protein
MGRVIANRIKGMGWQARLGLIATLTVVCSVFMYQGLWKPNPIDSATSTYYLGSGTAGALGSGGNTDATSSAPAAPTTSSSGNLPMGIGTFATSTNVTFASAPTPLNAWYPTLTSFGPVYGARTTLDTPAVALRVQDAAASGTHTIFWKADIYDYDPAGASGNGTLLWSSGGSNSTANRTVTTLTLNGFTSGNKTISAGHRLKMVVSANPSTTGSIPRLLWGGGNSAYSFLKVNENFPTGTVYLTNLVDYNGGNINGVTPGQQNVGMLSFQLTSNATPGGVWTGGKLDKIGTNANLDDATFAIYKESEPNVSPFSFNPSSDLKISDDISFSQASGQGYTLVTPQALSSVAARYYVVFNLSPAAAAGTTLGAQILDESYLSVSGNNVNPMLSGASSTISVLAVSSAVQKTYQVDFNSGTPFSAPLPAAGATSTSTACTTTPASYSGAAYGLLNYPNHSCTAPGTANYNTLTASGSLTLYFNGAGYATGLDRLQAGSFSFWGASGTSGSASTLKAALFYVTPGGTKVPFPQAFDATLNLGTSTVMAAKLISFDGANYNALNVPRGSRLGMTLTVSGASAKLGLNSAAGAKLLVSETATVSNGVDVGDGKVLGDANVTAGATGRVVDAFTMVAGAPQSVTSLTVTGNNANATNISYVKIYRDNVPSGGAYGTLGDEDVLLGTGSFSGASAVVPLNEAVGTATARYLVVYDFASGAVVGQKVTGTVTAVGGASSDVIADTTSAGLTLVASTVVTEGTGEPVSLTRGPNGVAANLDAFGLFTNGPSDTINTITVQLSPGASAAVAQMEIVERASGTVYGFSTAPISADTWRLTVAGLAATPATAQCYVRITPKSVVAGTYYVTGQVTAITHVQTGNALFYNDAASAIVTVDGIAPPDPSLSAATGTNPGEVKLQWSASTDSNQNNSGITYKAVRGPANAPAPVDCSSGTTVYQGAGTSAVDATGLSDGHSYTFGYRVCALDGAGNRSAGAIASASAKLPSICNQTPTVAFIDSPSQFAKTGGTAQYSVNIINNDIGDCPPVNFSIGLAGTPNEASFENPPLVSPQTLLLASNGAGGNVRIFVKALDTATQGERQTFNVTAVAPGYLASTATPLSTMVNNFGPMLHSSFSVGTKHGEWGTRSTCNDCHINPGEASKNIKMISEQVLTPTGRRPVVFRQLTSTVASTGIFGSEVRANQNASANICEVCHHDTRFHQYSAVKQATARDHHNGEDCMRCHPHSGGFKYVGGAADCVSCHGNPPTRLVEMVSPPLNALGSNPNDFGAHAKHDRIKMSCDACHNNYNRAKMGDSRLEMGFAVNYQSYSGFSGNVNSGTVTVSSNYNTLYSWASSSAGTQVELSANQSVPSCTVYCHGFPGGGGSNPKPTWVGSYQASCGTCHNVTNDTPPSSGSHLKHASSGQFQLNGVTVGGINMACDKCHGAYRGYTSARHVNGSVAWDLSGIAAGALYKGQTQGATGALAPSASFGSCSNLYCHSNVQGPDGTGAPTTYNAPTWGESASCGSCHLDMYTNPGATGGHKQHAQPSQDFATPFDCRICHGAGGTTNPLNHANGVINTDFSGYGSNTLYSRGANVAPGTAYGDCSNSDCHGRRTVTWGPSSALPLCDKCHGSKNSDGGFYTTSGPGTTVSNTDPIVGAHNAHIHSRSSAFTLYTSYSQAKDCSECHIKPGGPYDAGHIDTALPAEVTFQPSAIANRGVFFGVSGARPANFDVSARTCNNIWCHGSAMDSNLGRGAYANVVADGGSLGTPVVPTWNAPFLTGVPSNDCTRCHSYPPPAPNESYAHFSHYSTDELGVDIARLKGPNECNGCHINVKPDGSGFINGAAHINGSVDKGCQACHGVPPATQAELALPSNGALASGQAGAHKAHADLPAIGKTCTVCHNGYTNQMPSQLLEIGFNAFGGKFSTGAFWGYSTMDNGLTSYASSSAGTLVYQTNSAAEQNSCAVYCHGLNAAGVATIGGRFGANAKPVWDSGASMVCGNCHGVNVASSAAYQGYTAALHLRPSSAPTSSSHPRHAGVAALNLTCDTCHGVITNFNHVNGSVAWKLDSANPLLGAGAVYGPAGNQAVSGATGNLAPSASYGTCSNLYCHSSGQSADGNSSIPNYATAQWGSAALACNSCHADMTASGTGSHSFHTQASAGSYTCISCHGAGYTATPGSITATTHVDRAIDLSAGAGYAKGTSFALGSGYQSCTNNCHGSGTPTWGVALYSAAQCQKCHGDASSAAFYSTSYPVQVTAQSDRKVGAHNGHLKGSFNYSAPLACSACHPSVTGVNDPGHLNGTVNFNAATITSYDPSTGTCTSTCHKGKSVAWNDTAYLSGTPSATECSKCHDAPPASAAHLSAGVAADFAARGFAACVSCHPHLKADGSFNNKALHMNGAVDAMSAGGSDCSACHSTLTGMTGATGSYHHVLASTSPDYSGNTCLKCHVDHNIFQSAQNAANTVGLSANLRVDNALVPQVGDAPGTSYSNTDFLPGASNGGVCVSCHSAGLAKNLAGQKSDASINASTVAVGKAQYLGSLHNYTTSSTFTKDSSKFLANCSKCHSDTSAETKQVGAKTFGLHLSSTRELFTPLGAAAPFDAREDRLCFGCHSQKNDLVDSGQSVKPTDGKDWYGGRAMRASAEDTFKSFSSATRVFRHNVGKYNAKHNATESQSYLGANKHVECADCHNSHAAQFGNHTLGSATLANSLKGAGGLLPSFPAPGGASAGFPGVSGSQFYFINTSPGTPSAKKTTDTIAAGGTAFNSQNMQTGAGSTLNSASYQIPSGTAASTSFLDTAFVSPVMSAGTLVAQTMTLSMYGTCSSSTSPNRARVRGYVYLWDGNTATQLAAATNSGSYLPTTAALQSIAFAIPQTAVSAGQRLVVEVYVQTGSAATTAAMTATLSWGSATASSNISFATAPVVNWVTASSYASQPATAEYQICFKCHSNANPNLSSWGGSGAAAWTDLAIEFNPNNQSYHPVIQALPATGNRQLAVGALTGGWAPGMVMNCTDCHATDSAASKGPHGSTVKWMLTGTNKNWPYTSAANNGKSSGTLLTGTGSSSTLPNGGAVFCLNCHVWGGGGAGHTRGDHSGLSCVGCHIRVPHGGKGMRLTTGTNAPARYKPDGVTNSAPGLLGINRPASGVQSSENACLSTCSHHNGNTSVTVWW